MKILVFSDTHLTEKFDQKKFNFLYKIVDSSDRVIINGDFWDYWFTNFDDFIKSEWNRLFPLLLKKDTIYIYGNHDPAKIQDQRVNMFSNEAVEEYTLHATDKTYLIKHGHQTLEGKRSKLIDNYSKIIFSYNKSFLINILHQFLNLLGHVGYKYVGKSLMRKSKFAKRSNKIMKLANNSTEFMICGDTHCAEIDSLASFANSGCILYGKADYLLIEDGKISLHRKNY